MLMLYVIFNISYTCLLQLIRGLGFPFPAQRNVTFLPFLVLTIPALGIGCTAGGTNTST